MVLRGRRRRDVVLLGLLLCSCDGESPPRGYTDFLVAVGQETFFLRSTDSETIRLATENFAGKNHRFPLGPLRAGDGGFNAPWPWHLDPAETRLVEAAIEVCDGTPSYVRAHLVDFPTYCPWSARIVAIRP
jgi:hypothetical protein